VTDPRFGRPQDLLRKSPAKNAGGAAAPAGDGRLHLAAGEALFNQGDPGGDLYFIEQGAVEIFTEKGGETIELASMGPGEIIGVMTCLTCEPRMASARAKSDVTMKKVPYAAIKKTVLALPGWMKIVLKEFTIRLAEMNRHYTEAVLRAKQLEASQVDAVFLGAQMAAAFGAIAEPFAIRQDDHKIVIVADMVDKLEAVLNLDRGVLDRIWQVLLDSGLLRIEIEPDKKRTVARLENAQKMTHFATFVKDARHGPTKKLVRARFTHKETRVMSALVKLAARLGMDLDKVCRFSTKELASSLERATGVKFDREALEKGVGLKLLALEQQGDDLQVVMKPAHLGRTVACIEAMRRLAALDLRRESRSRSAA
jgi:CRP-like cAMP-binding protein